MKTANLHALESARLKAILLPADKEGEPSFAWIGRQQLLLMELKPMISLKRYLESAKPAVEEPHGNGSPDGCVALLSAYRSALAEIGECGASACPDLASELKGGLTRLDEDLGDHPGLPAITMTREALHELLQGWGSRTALHYQQKAAEVTR